MYKKPLALTILLFTALFTVCVTSFNVSAASSSQDDDILSFDDTQLEEELIYPDWFKLSMGDLRDDLEEAKKAGKKGIITYFGQKRCAYCEQFFKTSLADVEIQNYLRDHYDIIAFDIWGVFFPGAPSEDLTR